MPGANPEHAEGVLATSREDSAEAFEDLFEGYFDRLTAYCRRIGGQEESEDLAQEALLRAWANLERFETSRPMWPWLKTIARNLAIDRARTRGREIPLEPDHDEPSFDGVEERFEERAVLSEAIKRLTPAQQTALRLRYLEDWDTGDVARFLGLSVPALKQLAYRARERLLTEYRRMTSGAFGWILLPLGAIRRWLRIPVSRAQRTAARAGSNFGLAGDGGYQLAVGVLGLTLVLGSGATPPASDPPDRRLITPAAAHPLTGHPPRLPSSTTGTAAARTSDDPPPPPSGAMPSNHISEPPKNKKVNEAAHDIVEGVTDPNGEIQQPEDARIQSVVFSPRFASDGTVFAAGVAGCDRRLCYSVLFRSSDGGVNWTREPALGMVADALLLPPGYGQGDHRIFAMGAQGLQVSDDDGDTFRPAPVASGPQSAGSAAMSPSFNGDDPSILIGAEALMRYRDDRRTLEPVPGTAPVGPFEPAYSPDHPSDRTILLGGSRLDPATGTVATVYRCVDALCSAASLEGEQFRPKIRLAPDFSTTGKVFAFTPEAIFVSEDGGEAFAPLPPAWTDELLWDLVFGPQGQLVASTVPENAGGPAGVYMSSDGGRSWTELQSDLFASGAASIAISGDRIVLGLGEGGAACSSDAGVTWASRCPSPE